MAEVLKNEEKSSVNSGGRGQRMLLEILHRQPPQQWITGYNDKSAEGGNPCSEVSILNEVESIPKEVGADFYRIKKKKNLIFHIKYRYMYNYTVYLRY